VYTYVYDSFVTGREHERLLSRLETRLTDLGISGRVERLTMFKDVREIIRDAVERGCETVVAVGNDETVSKLVSVLGDHDLALGVIPVGEGPHRIAGILGVASDVESCNILSRRVMQTIDLGRINDQWFLSSVEFPATKATFSCNGAYAIVPTEENEVRVCNLAPIEAMADGTEVISSPRDGLLDTIFRPAQAQGLFSRFFRSAPAPTKPTVVPVRNLKIRYPKPFTVIRDGLRLSSTTLDIEIVPKRLKVVVGKGRKFE
jgi:diacylglycerol kinase family enzyme